MRGADRLTDDGEPRALREDGCAGALEHTGGGPWRGLSERGGGAEPGFRGHPGCRQM